MDVVELRDLDEARRLVLQGLWLQRAVPPSAATVKPALEWALEMVAAGHPLPPVGFVADLGHVAFGADRSKRADPAPVPGFPPGLARTYEDHVLGKVYADYTFERAADALRRYQGRDRGRGLSFAVNQIRDRARFGGVLLPPGVLRSALELAPEEALTRGWELLQADGPSPSLVSLYESLVAAARRTAELLGPEDVFELEHGTALAELGQRVALRQVLQTAKRIDDLLPRHKVRPLAGRQEVPTRVLDEDTYPVGGYTSISTRGSVESLLHSQLAYIEPGDPVDLFTVKYIRDELFFYSRDENQFLRRRRTFTFALFPDLAKTRFKDAELPVQRVILALSLVVAAVRKLSEWLSTDALVFELLFVQDGTEPALPQERNLLEVVLREQIANGSVRIETIRPDDLARHCALRARRSLCHLLTLSVEDRDLEAEDTVTSRLVIDAPQPAVGVAGLAAEVLEADGPFEGWAETLERLLQVWV